MPPTFDPRDALLAEATEIIRRPAPELGWSGDTDLFVCYERLEDVWSVWREDGDGRFRPVLKQRTPGQKLDPTLIIRSLVARDTHLRNNSHADQMERLIEHNVAVTEAAEATAAERLRETMEKVYHAAATKDLDVGYVRPLLVTGTFKDRITALPD